MRLHLVTRSVLQSQSIFDRLRVFFWPAPAPAPALVKKYALKKLKKMNNSTSCNRKNTFLRISFLFVHVGTQEQNRLQKSQTLPTVVTVPVLTGSVFSEFFEEHF